MTNIVDRWILRHRRQRDEWMDDPSLDADRHRLALRGLRRLNWISGVVAAMDRDLRRMVHPVPADRPLRLLDVASGSGDVAIELARRTGGRGRPVDLTTVDISDVAIGVQRSAAQRAGIELTALQMDVFVDSPPGRYDVAMCSLFFHHLCDEQSIDLIRRMRSIADAVLICDLRRSRFNLTCVNTAAHLVSRSDVVHHDADASVRGAYSRAEFQSLADRALGPRTAKVRPVFPCRMMLSF